jgi:hypothetical protein
MRCGGQNSLPNVTVDILDIHKTLDWVLFRLFSINLLIKIKGFLLSISCSLPINMWGPGFDYWLEGRYSSVRFSWISALISVTCTDYQYVTCWYNVFKYMVGKVIWAHVSPPTSWCYLLYPSKTIFFSFVVAAGWGYVSRTGSLTGPLSIPRTIHEWKWSSGGMILTGQNRGTPVPVPLCPS